MHRKILVKISLECEFSLIDFETVEFKDIESIYAFNRNYCYKVIAVIYGNVITVVITIQSVWKTLSRSVRSRESENEILLMPAELRGTSFDS